MGWAFFLAWYASWPRLLIISFCSSVIAALWALVLSWRCSLGSTTCVRPVPHLQSLPQHNVCNYKINRCLCTNLEGAVSKLLVQPKTAINLFSKRTWRLRWVSSFTCQISKL
jgi:hypothetical protein